MPQIVIAAAAGWAGSAVATLVGSQLIGSAVSLALTYAGSALLGSSSQKKPAAPSPRDRMQMVRSSVQPRSVVYGRARVSGPLVFAGSTGQDHAYLHLVIPLASHEIDAVERVWFNDKALTLNADGYATNYFATGQKIRGRQVESYTTTGEKTVTISPPSGDLLSIDSVTVGTLYEGEGWASNAQELAFTTSGADVTFTLPADTSGVVAISYTYRTVTGYYARVKIHLGTDDQAADPDLVSECGSLGWTTDHRLRGIAYLYVRLTWAENMWYSGIPNVSAVIRGKKVLDPRTSTTAWSNNWALCMYDWLRSYDGLRCEVADVDTSTVTAAADISDQTLVWDEDNSRPRYTVDGVISTEEQPISVLQKLAEAGAGAVIWTQGQYRIFAGAPGAAVRTLTADDLRAPLQVRARTARKDLANGVRVSYVEPNRYQEAEIKPISVAAYVAQDAGEDVKAELKLPFTTHYGKARHLGLVHLKRSRQGIVVRWPGKMTVFGLAVWDVVNLNIPQLGWASKPFRVMGWTLGADGQGVDLELREEAASDWDLDLGTIDTGDTAPDTTLPDPGQVGEPQSLALSEELYRTVGDAIKTRVRIAWTAPADALPVEYEVQWRYGSESAWRSVYTTYTELALDDARTGPILACVRARNAVGVWGDFCDVERLIVVGKTTPPPAPDTFTLEIVGGGARSFSFALTNPPLDLAGFQIRYNAGTTASAWGSQTLAHQGTLKASPWETQGFADGTYTFTCRTIDTSGNLSTTGVSITATLTPPAASVVVASESGRGTTWLG